MKKIFLIGFLAATMIFSAFPTWAGEWKEQDGHWTYLKDDGTTPKSTWEWIDGDNDSFAEHYYFDENGILLTNTNVPVGGYVNENGAEEYITGLVPIRRIKTSNPDSNTIKASTDWSGTYIMDQGKTRLIISGLSHHGDDRMNWEANGTYFIESDTTPKVRSLYLFLNDTNTEAIAIAYDEDTKSISDKMTLALSESTNEITVSIEKVKYSKFKSGTYTQIDNYY